MSERKKYFESEHDLMTELRSVSGRDKLQVGDIFMMSTMEIIENPHQVVFKLKHHNLYVALARLQ